MKDLECAPATYLGVDTARGPSDWHILNVLGIGEVSAWAQDQALLALVSCIPAPGTPCVVTLVWDAQLCWQGQVGQYRLVAI